VLPLPCLLQILDKHYGKSNASDVAAVKKLYIEMGIEDLFKCATVQS
jgi:hypothetical protein